MRLLADLHIAPRTVEFLRTLGHDVVRVTDLLPADSADEVIVERAAQERRTILTQDLVFYRSLHSLVDKHRHCFPSA